MDGLVSVLETGKPGKDRFTRLIGTMKGLPEARILQWRPSKLELIVGYENGQVTVWRTQTAEVARNNFAFPL